MEEARVRDHTGRFSSLAYPGELSRPALARTISENVKDGSIAHLPNKPYSFLLYQFSNSLGETIFRALMNALLGSLIVLLAVGHFRLGLRQYESGSAIQVEV